MKLLFTLLFVATVHTVSAYGWVQQTDFGGEARHRTTMLAIGNKIYAGLGHYNGAGINVLFEDWWEFDPSTNAWTQKADYMGGICYHAAGFTIGNYGYVGTGRISVSGSVLVKDFFRYDPTTNTWIQLTDFPGSGRRGAVAFAIGDYGYMGTGTSSSDFYRYNPANDSWIQIASVPGGSRMSAVGFSIGGYGYCGTGYSYTQGWSSSEFYKYNPTLNQWTQIQDVGIDPLGGPTITRMESCGFELNGKGYVLTGDNISSGTNYKDMYELNPSTETWTKIEDFPGTARRYLSAIALNGYGYAGLGTNGTNFKDFWKFDQTLSLLERNIDDIQVKAYPNPTTDFVVIDVNWDNEVPFEKMQVKIISLEGKVVHESKMEINENKIETSSFNPGTYIYSIVYEDRIVKNGKIVVQ
jgi:N-acetylneuraminic acid mutarotase